MRVPTMILFLAALNASAENEALLVEVRWIESALPPAALAVLRDQSTVWTTSGSISPKPAGTTISTRRPEDDVGPVRELRVLNGHEASQRFESTSLVQWVEGDARHARLRAQPVVQASGFAVTPQWPGGKAPVKLSIRLLDAGQEFSTTVSQPLGEWHTVLRTGGQARAEPRGTTSTREAQVVPARELQLRVSLEP